MIEMASRILSASEDSSNISLNLEEQNGIKVERYAYLLHSNGPSSTELQQDLRAVVNTSFIALPSTITSLSQLTVSKELYLAPSSGAKSNPMTAPPSQDSLEERLKGI